MMKKLFSVAALALALNFLAVAGVAGWLVATKHLDKKRIAAVKAILFPPPPALPVATTQPDPTTQPSARLAALLSQASGKPVDQQVQFIQKSFDEQMAELDSKARELEDVRAQIQLARAQELKDRAKIDRDEKALTARAAKANKLATDTGFQDSLQLYNTMPPKQVKGIFMTLPDSVVEQYLQAMQPRTATNIIKEFKLPDETSRIEKVLELMRLQNTAAPPAPVSPQAAPDPEASLNE